MAKLTDLVAKSATKPQFKDKTSEQISDILYSQQSQRLRQARDELKRARTTKDKKLDINIGLQPDGTLSLNHSVMQNGLLMNGKEVLVRSEALSKLANAIRPLMGLARAVTKANGLIQNQPLHVLDSDRKRTNVVMKKNGETLYNVDPLSQLKHICYILEHNKDARAALDVIESVLKEASSDNMKNSAVTQKIIQSKQPVRLDTQDPEPYTSNLPPFGG